MLQPELAVDPDDAPDEMDEDEAVWDEVVEEHEYEDVEFDLGFLELLDPVSGQASSPQLEPKAEPETMKEEAVSSPRCLVHVGACL